MVQGSKLLIIKAVALGVVVVIAASAGIVLARARAKRATEVKTITQLNPAEQAPTSQPTPASAEPSKPTTKAKSSKPSDEAPETPKTYGDQKVTRFGGTLSYPVNPSKDSIDAQLGLLADLGVKNVRAIFFDCANAFWFANDELLDAAKRRGIEVVFILEPEINFKKTVVRADLPVAAVGCAEVKIGKQTGEDQVDLEQFGYDYTKSVVNQYKDRVKHWQLLNEVGGTAMVSNADGRLPEQFNQEIYDRLKYWLKGAARAVKESDPAAKRIINNQWLHVGMLDLLARDGISFEIIGWNWFVDDIDMEKVEYAKGKWFNLLQELVNRKPKVGAQEIWLSEFNRDHGSFDGKDQEQTDYLKRRIPELAGKGLFSAIFIHELFDKPSQSLDQDRHWGIIAVETAPLKFNPKPAARVYSDIIKNN